MGAGKRDLAEIRRLKDPLLSLTQPVCWHWHCEVLHNATRHIHSKHEGRLVTIRAGACLVKHSDIATVTAQEVSEERISAQPTSRWHRSFARGTAGLDADSSAGVRRTKLCALEGQRTCRNKAAASRRVSTLVISYAREQLHCC